MATYDQWNQALERYFLEDASIGAPIFISVDDDVLTAVGNEIHPGSQPDEAVTDFLCAVRQRVVRRERVSIDVLRQSASGGCPSGLAFLCATVLAATQMREDEDASQINYFRRLRKLLELPISGGRPHGMEGGAEELLWNDWNRHLRNMKFVPTAHRGVHDSQKFIQYPISQALLRLADRESLLRLFGFKRWSADWDVDTLYSNVRRTDERLTKHLRSNLLGSGDRLLAVQQAIHELYTAWKDKSTDFSRRSGLGERSSTVLAGLLRSEDHFTGNVEYFIYPKQPSRCHNDELTIERDAETITVFKERPGWWEPIRPAHACDIAEGFRCSVTAPSQLSQLVLPKKRFWILLPDPLYPESDILASWGRAPLGTPFTLLIHRTLVDQLRLLRQERLIAFDEEPYRAMGTDDWCEIRRCMVTSAVWSGVFIQDRELFDALRPIYSIAIKFEGGMRAPGVNGWMQDLGPRLSVWGFESNVAIRIVHTLTEDILLEKTVTANTWLDIPWDRAGDYRVEAASGDLYAERPVQIWSWEDLRIATNWDRISLLLESARLCGASLEPLTRVR